MTPTTFMWGIVSMTLTLGTVLSALLATVTLDMLVRRPEGAGSMTTLMPGLAYAIATTMKVCIAAGLVTIVMALAQRLARGPEAAPGAPRPSKPVVSKWGITSMALAPLTPIVGAVAVVIGQELATETKNLSVSDFSQISRTAVLLQLSVIVLGAASAAISLARQGRPATLSVLGLAMNAALIALFWHFEFYAFGFDQDTWAPR